MTVLELLTLSYFSPVFGADMERVETQRQSEEAFIQSFLTANQPFVTSMFEQVLKRVESDLLVQNKAVDQSCLAEAMNVVFDTYLHCQFVLQDKPLLYWSEYREQDAETLLDRLLSDLALTKLYVACESVVQQAFLLPVSTQPKSSKPRLKRKP
ncbi:conserved hypothetical protein [Vibrio crassostreae]|uniref:hypothetical protein n=1 Tax=Vibrio lentus TaxID=136468 RepID=UPI000C8172B0|nr:hypothetical protein [Vibrio lentus]PMG23770.1 hypothetical protein BCU96_13510 [Vibrio lentus]CAK2223607.1 conserved hypothetical protein [Vibrio crassostreae]